LFATSSLSLTAVWYARFYQAEPAPVVGTTKCPEPLCPMSALPSSGSRTPGSSEDITPRSSLLRTHSPIPCGSPFLRLLASCKESLQVVTSPCCHRDYPDVILRIFPVMLEPIPRRFAECTCLVLPHCRRPSPRGKVGRLPASFREHDFSRAAFRGCSYFVMFRPHSLLASQIVPTSAAFAAGRPRLLHPS
jgi:hypothetical protein